MRKRTIIAILAIGCLLTAGAFALSPLTFSIGTYVAADSPVIVFDRGAGEPVVMCGSGERMFSGLRTGDRILVLHNGTMMLSYPAQMNIFFCVRLKKGDVSDIPEETMNRLGEMGWLQGGAFGQNQ